MGSQAINALVAVLTAVIGVAIVTVLVKSGNQTAQVLSAGGSAFGKILSVAEGGSSSGSNPFGSGGVISTV